MSGAFDDYAQNYDADLARGIKASGEDKLFFAGGRTAWLHRILNERKHPAGKILDFGCGTGTSGPFLLQLPLSTTVVGVDPSADSISVARQSHVDDRLRYLTVDDYVATGECDTAFCNGVFHHIPPTERAAALQYVYRALRPGGVFAFWENNPWNPGTRYVMSRIPFDRDAVTISFLEAKRLLTDAGFRVIRADFLFVFPHMLRWFRRFEPAMSGLPLGAQYEVLCVKDF